jgi:hypothetical protein
MCISEADYKKENERKLVSTLVTSLIVTNQTESELL